MDIRLISLDLDGTALLPDQASFSQRTEDALLAAHRQGVAIVPTTGRQFAMLPPPLRVKQSWANLAVLCNGAEIRRLESGEVLASRYMTAETLRPLIDRAAALGLMVELSAGGTLYLTAEDWARERTIDRLTFHLGVLDRRGQVAEGPLSAFAAGRKLSTPSRCKFSIFCSIYAAKSGQATTWVRFSPYSSTKRWTEVLSAVDGVARTRQLPEAAAGLTAGCIPIISNLYLFLK